MCPFFGNISVVFDMYCIVYCIIAQRVHSLLNSCQFLSISMFLD